MKSFVFAFIIILVIISGFTFAELLCVSDCGPDDNSRDSFVRGGGGFDVLITAPEMEKGFF